MTRKIKVFTVNRQFDVNGTSGTGHVITGIVLTDGKVIAHWETETPSIAIHESWDHFYKTHIGDHPENDTIIEEVYINIDDVGKLAINIGELLINR